MLLLVGNFSLSKNQKVYQECVDLESLVFGEEVVFVLHPVSEASSNIII